VLCPSIQPTGGGQISAFLQAVAYDQWIGNEMKTVFQVVQFDAAAVIALGL